MPWGDDPVNDEADAVRSLVGDTDATDPLLSDNTYTNILAVEARLYPRAALAANAIAGFYAKQMRKRVGSLWRFAEQRFKHYHDLAQRYRLEGQRRAVGPPFAGGISESDVLDRNQDTDRVKAYFKAGMHDTDFAEDRTVDREYDDI